MYFVRHTSPKIVTNAYMLDSTIQAEVLEAIEVVDEKVADHKAALSDTVEVYINLDGDNTCGYYLIDHSLRVQFWLDEVDTDELYLPPSASEEHFRGY